MELVEYLELKAETRSNRYVKTTKYSFEYSDFMNREKL